MSRNHAYTLNKKLERVLATLRRESGWTQIDIAKRLHKPQSYVSKYETGERRLSVGDFILVCAALETSPSEILAQLTA